MIRAVWGASASDVFFGVDSDDQLIHFDGTKFSPVVAPGFGTSASFTGTAEVLYGVGAGTVHILHRQSGFNAP